MVVVIILAGLLLIGISHFRARAERIRCVTNLRNLYIAADLYVQQNGSWPQIARNPSSDGAQEYARQWVEALAPFGAQPQTWICPTIEGLLHNPDYLQPDNVRIDYIPMPFDDKPGTPHLWPQAPWFVEAGDVHGHGNLIIFTDGNVSDLKTFLAQTQPSP